MHLSREAGWYDVNGNAEYIRANERYADDDPAVKAVPAIFDKISDDAPPKAAVKAAEGEGEGRGSEAEGWAEIQGPAGTDDTIAATVEAAMAAGMANVMHIEQATHTAGDSIGDVMPLPAQPDVDATILAGAAAKEPGQ